MADKFGNEPYSALWQTVLNHVIAELKDGPISYEPNDRIIAERWIGSFPSKDFREVCTLAGINPDATHKCLKKLIQREREKRAGKREDRKTELRRTHHLQNSVQLTKVHATLET